MKLYGITVDQTFEEIVLSDCPAFISEDRIAHLAVTDSPLFFANTIVYFDELNDVCEGDVILSNGRKLGVAYYSGGWFVHQFRGRNKKLSDVKHISVVRGNRNYINIKQVTELDCRKPVKLCALGKEFELNSLIMIKGNEIIVSGQRSHALRNEIFISAGVCDDDGSVLRFGGYYDGGVVIMDSTYRIAVKHFDGSIEQLNLEED